MEGREDEELGPISKGRDRKGRETGSGNAAQCAKARKSPLLSLHMLTDLITCLISGNPYYTRHRGNFHGT